MWANEEINEADDLWNSLIEDGSRLVRHHRRTCQLPGASCFL